MYGILAAILLQGVAAAEGPKQIGSQSGFHVEVADRGQLQSLLDQHHWLLLDADRDYRSSTLPALRISTGMRLIGGWNTRVPPIIIEAGASDVVVDSVRSDAKSAPDIVFASGAETHDVRILGGNGGPGTWIRIRVVDGARLDHIEITDFGGLEVGQKSAGYVRNSTFSRLLGYWPGPDVSWHGNSGELSFANVFLAMSSITPQQGSLWVEPGNLWLVNLDCESWNMHDRSQNQCFRIEGAQHIFSAGLSGGTAYGDRAGALAIVRDTAGLVSWLFHGKGGSRDQGDLQLERVGVAALLERDPASQLADRNPPAGSARIDIPFQLSGPSSLVTRHVVAAQADAMAILLQQNPPPLNRGKPLLRAIKDPIVARGAALDTMADSSVMLQSLIDQQGVARLEPGVYYLDRPLRVGSTSRTEGLLGSDEGSVVLVPKGAFAAIQGRGDVITPANAEAVLVSLTFDRFTVIGGTEAFDWSAEKGNFGQGVTVAFSNFSHLRLLHQSVAAVRVNQLHGIDANSWVHNDFIDTPFAFLGNGRGISGPMGYADKQAFIDCQFQDIRSAVWSWDTDRPSGGELWQDDVFDHVAELSQTRSASGLLWANSVFHNVSGPVAIHVLDHGDTTTGYFYQFDCLWQGIGPAVVTDSLSFRLGTLFLATRFEQHGGGLIAEHGQTLFSAYTTLPAALYADSANDAVLIDSPSSQSKRELEVVQNGRESLYLDHPVTAVAAPVTNHQE